MNCGLSDANRFIMSQSRLNFLTEKSWNCYSSHRKCVTEAVTLRARAGNKDTLCILGAGNCNDLELQTLAHLFREIHLVDLDATALRRGLRRQYIPGDSRIVAHGGVDVTGIAARLAKWHNQKPTSEEIDEVLCKLLKPQKIGFKQSFELVLSSTLLTQLIGVAALAIGNHPKRSEFVRAIRSAHLRLLLELTESKGTAILITDFVSSDTCERLRWAENAELPKLMRDLVQSENVFTGANPFVLSDILRGDLGSEINVADLQVIYPWRWWISPTKCYLVVGLICRKK